ncbi:hypothetical protein ROA7450_04046 [Roseovarius albus]|uniref:Uncharacterized protein n=1 Tax=Roseovarius albus TaxID=1247867 RepID=A0A1X7A7Q2_9RHOB|nr:hypothetical protein [Roseovarius albus]SLN72601.1 hypothetical protein ROA7450_04046 [Roseovarius albus]
MGTKFIGVLIISACIIGLAPMAVPYFEQEEDETPPAITADEATERLIKEQQARPDRASVKPVAVQRKRNYEAPDPTDILLAPETGLGLGWGWNAFHGEAIPTHCVQFKRDKPFKGQTSSLGFSEVNDQYELQAAMDMSAEASVKSVGYDVEGEMKFSTETSISGSSLTYLIEAEVLNAPWVALPPGDAGGHSVELTPMAERLAQRDLEQFKDVCGTGYVSATYGGAKLSIVVEIKTSSQDTRSAMSASVSGGGWGTKVSSAMSGSSSSSNEQASREISFFQSGGQPEKLPTTPKDIVEAAETLAGQADKAEKIFRIAVTPYEVLSNWPREESLSGSEVEYEELAALWGSYQALYTDLQDALESPDAFVVPYRNCAETPCTTAFLPATNAKVRDELKDLQDDVLIGLDRLELAARACITAEEMCETNAALYRSPYAYQVAMPVRTCLLLEDFNPDDAKTYKSAKDEVYLTVYGAPIRTKEEPDEQEHGGPLIEEFFPEIELACNGAGLSGTSGVSGALPIFASMMIEETAKGRCALSSLTPGCLSNADIAAWGERIGHQSILLTSAKEVEAVIAAAAEPQQALSSDAANCAFLKDADSWLIGDPGTQLKTSLWVPPICMGTVKQLINDAAETAAPAAAVMEESLSAIEG